MFKISKTCSMLFVAAVLGCFCAGCGDGNYVAEKLSWHAAKYEKKILEEYQGNPPETAVDKLAADLKEITLRYPLWPGSAKAHLKLGEIFEKRKNPDAALKEYERVRKNFSGQPENCSEAIKRMAVIYEARNDWPRAQSLYGEILTVYPYSNVGMFVPMYFARRYLALGEKEKAMQAFQSGADFYAQVVENNPGEQITLRGLDFLVQCREALGEQEKVIAYLENVAKNNSGKTLEFGALLQIAQIYSRDPRTQEKARSLYELVVEKFPDNDVSRLIRQDLDKEK